MDKKNNNVADVSAFFIFEATGDSEAEFDDPNKAASTTTTIDRDNDDAESSCRHDDDYDDDDDDDLSADNFPFVNNKDEVNGGYYDNVQVCVDDQEEEGEEAHSYHPAWPQAQQQQHNNNNHNNHNHNNSGRKKSVDSNQEELMSEMEKNKLFWENCLAS